MDTKLVELLNYVIRDPLCPCFCHFCPRVWQISSPRGCRMHSLFISSGRGRVNLSLNPALCFCLIGYMLMVGTVTVARACQGLIRSIRTFCVIGI